MSHPLQLRLLNTQGIEVRVGAGESVVLDLDHSFELLKALGRHVHNLNALRNGTREDWNVAKALRFESVGSGVATENNDAVVSFAFADFPTIRFSIPEDKLRSTASTLLEIANAPHDVRNQRPN